MRALPRDLNAAAACPTVWTACCDRFERSQSKKTMNYGGAAAGGGGGGGGGGSEAQAATSSVVARTTNSFLSMILFPQSGGFGRAELLSGPRTSGRVRRKTPQSCPGSRAVQNVRGPLCSAGSGSELVELCHVVPQDALLQLRTEMGGLLGDHVLAVRPSRITVREVACPHELVRIELVGELKGRPVVLEGECDVLAEILRRQALQLLALHPVAMALVGVVHAIHEMRRPACVGFDTDDAQPGMPFEHA